MKSEKKIYFGQYKKDEYKRLICYSSIGNGEAIETIVDTGSGLYYIEKKYAGEDIEYTGIEH